MWVREKNIGELAKSPQRAATTVSKWLRDQDALVEMSRNARAAAKPKATDRIAEDLMGLVEGVQRTATGVLRDQPEDVAKYGYEYFLKKMEEAKAKAEGYAT